MAPSLTWTTAGTWPTMPARLDAETSLADLTESALVEACLAGRPGAFDLVVERHRRSVYQLCCRFVGNHEDASDLSQDVFLRAYRGLRGFRGRSSLATWLYRIGVNVCLNRVSAKAPLDGMTEPIEDRAVHRHAQRVGAGAFDQTAAGRACARGDRRASAEAARDVDPAASTTRCRIRRLPTCSAARSAPSRRIFSMR